MSGQRSADDAGDNSGNDGSSNLSNNNSGSNTNSNHNNNNNANNNNFHHPMHNTTNHHHYQQQQHHHHHHRIGSGGSSSSSSNYGGMAGGCAMQEGADSVGLRSSSSISSSNNMIHHHPNHHHHHPLSSRTSTTTAVGIHNNNNNTAATAAAAATTPDGLAVFTWGRGEDGQLGLGDTSDQDEPTYVDALRGVGVRQIACGSGHTVILTTDGEIFTWGRGDDGRLGHGGTGWKYVPRLCQSLSGCVVTTVTCGSYHTAAVTSSGDLWTWGGGMYGKLGHGNEAGSSTPKRVEGLMGLQVIQIACGSRHTAVVTSTGALYSWGDKENGVAGHGDADIEGHQYTPRLVERLAGKRVVQLSACGFHTGCLTDQGECFTWGEGKFGRLGHNSESNCLVPRQVEALMGQNPIQLSCGGFHTAVVTEDGRLYTFGGGEHGQLGHNDRVNKLKPTLVEALEDVFISQVTCGWSHSVALDANGRVYTWGNSDHGKLGHGSSRKVAIPQIVEKLKDYRVVRVASYNEHTAALVDPSFLCGPGNSPVNNVPVTAAYTAQIRALVNDDEFSDVTFMIENEPVYAHRAILAQRCSHFAAMFRSGMRESNEKVIAIPSISKKVFLMLLEYIYVDSVKIEVEHAIELYIAADLYHMERLREMCCTVVRRNLSAENSGSLLQQASESHCDVLKEVCMNYVVEHFDAVSKTEGIKLVSHALLLEILTQR